MGQLLTHAKKTIASVPPRERTPNPCADLQTMFGNSFLAEMMCANGPKETYSPPGPMAAATVAGATRGAKGQPLRAPAFSANETAAPPSRLTRGLATADVAMSAYNAHGNLMTLNNAQASLAEKGHAAGSLPGDAMGMGGGVVSLAAPASPLGPALGVGSMANGVTRLGDRRMSLPLGEGGWGKSGSTWASEVGMSAKQALGNGTTGEIAGAAATLGASVAACVPALGEGLIGVGEGVVGAASTAQDVSSDLVGGVMCEMTDCDGSYADKMVDYRRAKDRYDPRSPKAVATRQAGAGQCAGESNYDVDHYVATGERVAPREYENLPAFEPQIAPFSDREPTEVAYPEIPPLGCQSSPSEDPWKLFDERGMFIADD